MSNIATGDDLRQIRMEAGLSLATIAKFMSPPVTRQYLYKVERKGQVAAAWVGRYQSAVTASGLQDVRESHARLVAGPFSKDLGNGLYSGIGDIRDYDEGYSVATRWFGENKRISRVTLVVTGWAQTQGVIDALSAKGVQVTLMDERRGYIRRRA